MSSVLCSLFIKYLTNCYYVRPHSSYSPIKQNWSFIDHLSPVSPTENIFNLLRSIHSESLIRSYLKADLVFDMLKVIIKWLEVSFKECNRQLETPQTDNPICSRGLVLSGRATCTIASRVNFKFFSVNVVNVDTGRRAFHNHQILYILKYLLYLSHQRIPSSLLISCSCKHYTHSNLNCGMIIRVIFLV